MNNVDLRSCGVISLILGVKVDTYTVTTSKSVASNSSKLTWRDIQGLSWVFEDDW